MLNNKIYNCLKWISLLAIPTVTLITSISETLGYAHGAELAAIVSALGVFAGTVIKISTDAYNASKEQ
jgi:hypothetical protein